MRRSTTPVVFAALAGLLIFAVSAAPPEIKQELHTQGPLHPWLHLVSFALLAFALLRIARSLVLKAILAVAIFLFGFYTEAREAHDDGWPIERRDVVTDAAGIALGSLLSLTKRRTRLSQRQAPNTDHQQPSTRL